MSGATPAPRRILVTGGAGYIGSHTVPPAHAACGDAPVVLDTLEHGHRRVRRGRAPDRRLDGRSSARASGSCGRSGSRRSSTSPPRKSTAESLIDPTGYFDRNVGDSIALLSAARRRRDRRIRLLVDLCRVRRGRGQSGCRGCADPAVDPVRREQGPGRADAAVAGGAAASGTSPSATSTRRVRSPMAPMASTPAGADNLVPRVVAVAMGRQPRLTVFGNDYPTPDGTAIRDYVHVADLARAHVAALEHLLGGGRSAVINLGTGTGSSVLDVVRAVERGFGRAHAADDGATPARRRRRDLGRHQRGGTGPRLAGNRQHRRRRGERRAVGTAAAGRLSGRPRRCWRRLRLRGPSVACSSATRSRVAGTVQPPRPPQEETPR